MRFAAFLRGINVGGNVSIKMSDLKKELEKAGFTEVKTLLASGNILLDSSQKDSRLISKKIELALQKKYGRRISTIVRPIRDLIRLQKGNPFRGVTVTKDTRMYVTFLDSKPAKHLKTAGEFFRVVKTCPFVVCSVLTLTADTGTVDLMDSLEKHYGKEVTTRNWNTVQKILKAAAV